MLSSFAEKTKQIDETMVLDITGDLDLKKLYGSDCMPDQSTDEKAISMNAGTESITAIAQMLREITERLDKMVKESAEYRKTINKEIDEKHVSWGNVLLLQIQESSDSIGVINRKIQNITKEREGITGYKRKKSERWFSAGNFQVAAGSRVVTSDRRPLTSNCHSLTTVFMLNTEY
jgi:hypothetical protein